MQDQDKRRSHGFKTWAIMLMWQCQKLSNRVELYILTIHYSQLLWGSVALSIKSRSENYMSLLIQTYFHNYRLSVENSYLSSFPYKIRLTSANSAGGRCFSRDFSTLSNSEDILKCYGLTLN